MRTLPEILDHLRDGQTHLLTTTELARLAPPCQQESNAGSRAHHHRDHSDQNPGSGRALRPTRLFIDCETITEDH